MNLAKYCLLRSIHRRIATSNRFFLDAVKEGLKAMPHGTKGRSELERRLAEDVKLGAILARLRTPIK